MSNSAERLVMEVREPLARAFACLSPRTDTIAKAWRRSLKRCETCREYAPILSALNVTLLLSDFASAQPRAHKQETELEGRNLARRGVPAECATLAIAYYVESCLQFIAPEACKHPETTKAMFRWAAAYNYYLLSGYHQHAHLERQSLEERVILAERRSQDFTVELGDAYEKERRLLAQDLHDEIGHDLIVLKLYTDVLLLDLKKGDTSQLRKKLRESLSIIRRAIKGVRNLTFDLGPAIWNEQGFVPAVRLYTRQFATRTGLNVRFDARGVRQSLPARYETALYKVLQGALANVAAHARAKQVTVRIATGQDELSMKVRDDGKGFNVGRKLGSPQCSYGLRAMRDRIELLGGTVNFVSQPARRQGDPHGTTIEIHLPLRGTDSA